MSELSREGAVSRALRAIERRRHVHDGSGDQTPELGPCSIGEVGRITVAFHPDRRDCRGLTAADGLLADHAYLPQWVTGASSGSRSAVTGGLRATWERDLFDLQPGTLPRHRPVYGALDLLRHRHGGSPAFGSCFLILSDHVRDRCTLTVGDSHLDPEHVGTFARPEAILAELVEQASHGELLGQSLDTDDLAAVLNGQHRDAPRRTLDHYVEAQVHGGVDLEDIDAIVVDPSFASSHIEDRLRAAATAANADFDWHPGSTPWISCITTRQPSTGSRTTPTSTVSWTN